MNSKIVLNEQDQKWVDATWEKIENKLSVTSEKSRDKIPYTTIDGVHDDRSRNGQISGWTNGFWGGLMWLMYKETGKETYRLTALSSEKMMDEALKNYKVLHHDVGFMWFLLSGANYRITGDEEAFNKTLFAAASLMARYNIDGKYIRAWNGQWDGKGNAGWSIIDCMMNIPLLYWASEQVDDPRFKRVAMSHADMTMRDHVRVDGSVNHIVEHDTETGEFVTSYAGQGCALNSCWTRGEAWGLYGFVLSYVHTKEQRYLDTAMKIADYFCTQEVAHDYLTPVDFRAPLEPVYYDSTAGVCAACGLLEIAKYVTEAEAKAYRMAAIRILKATDERFCNYSLEEDALVLMGTERYPSDPENLKGVHIPIIYGDFFFVEAILKLKGSDFLIW